MEQSDQTVKWDVLKEGLEAAWRHIPKPFRSDRSIHGTLQCYLYGQFCAEGYQVVADYFPPRIQDRAIELIALDQKQEIIYAVCFDNVVTLAAVKGLSSFAALHKIILTTGALEKKVQESRFFLKPEIQHIHLQPFTKS